MEQSIGAIPKESLTKTSWREVHPLAKTAIVLAGAGLATWGIIEGVKYAKKIAREAKSREAVKESKDTLKDLQKEGIKPSYSDSQYLAWAQSLQQQFDGCGTGTDKLSGIYSNMKNDADINKLIVAYGTRTVDKCGLGTGDFSGELTSTMAYKFSGVEGALNPYAVTIINSYFGKRGMKFRF